MSIRDAIITIMIWVWISMIGHHWDKQSIKSCIGNAANIEIAKECNNDR